MHIICKDNLIDNAFIYDINSTSARNKLKTIKNIPNSLFPR